VLTADDRRLADVPLLIVHGCVAMLAQSRVVLPEILNARMSDAAQVGLWASSHRINGQSACVRLITPSSIASERGYLKSTTASIWFRSRRHLRLARHTGRPGSRMDERAPLCWIAIATAAKSANTRRPLTPEVLVSGSKWAVVRARQPIESLIRSDSVPEWATTI
jgi:hypothetical protein